MNSLERYLELAQDLSATGEALAEKATEALRAADPVEQTYCDRAIVALALKIDSAFAALIDDSRAMRLEAMHHLKTMAEAFI